MRPERIVLFGVLEGDDTPNMPLAKWTFKDSDWLRYRVLTFTNDAEEEDSGDAIGLPNYEILTPPCALVSRVT